MRLRAALVDPGSLVQVQDITHLVVAGTAPTVSTSIDDSIYATGSIELEGMSTEILGQLIRLTVDDLPGGGAAIIGTFFATPSSVSRVESLVMADFNLSSTLLALESAQLTTTYVATGGTTSLEVISDMARLAGRSFDASEAQGDQRFGEAVFYEPGTPLLDVASEAADLAGLRLATDELGAITTIPLSGTGTAYAFTTLPGATTLTSPIEKDAAGLSAPNRATAIFVRDDDTAMTASAILEGTSLDAQTRGRYIDVSVDVKTMTIPSGGVLEEIARRALSDAQQTSWSFTTSFRGVRAGDSITVHDIDARETLVGIATSVETTLDPMCEQSISVRGVVQ